MQWRPIENQNVKVANRFTLCNDKPKSNAFYVFDSGFFILCKHCRAIDFTRQICYNML